MFTVYLLNVLFPLYVRSRDGFRVRLSLSTFRPVTLIKRNERGIKKNFHMTRWPLRLSKFPHKGWESPLIKYRFAIRASGARESHLVLWWIFLSFRAYCLAHNTRKKGESSTKKELSRLIFILGRQFRVFFYSSSHFSDWFFDFSLIVTRKENNSSTLGFMCSRARRIPGTLRCRTSRDYVEGSDLLFGCCCLRFFQACWAKTFLPRMQIDWASWQFSPKEPTGQLLIFFPGTWLMDVFMQERSFSQ